MLSLEQFLADFGTPERRTTRAKASRAAPVPSGPQINRGRSAESPANHVPDNQNQNDRSEPAVGTANRFRSPVADAWSKNQDEQKQQDQHFIFLREQVADRESSRTWSTIVAATKTATPGPKIRMSKSSKINILVFSLCEPTIFASERPVHSVNRAPHVRPAVGTAYPPRIKFSHFANAVALFLGEQFPADVFGCGDQLSQKLPFPFDCFVE
jgi:hypothetical protein